MRVGFVDGVKRENPEKNPLSKARNSNKRHPHIAGIEPEPQQ